MKKLTLIYVLSFFITFSQFSYAQVLVNQSWVNTTASPDFSNFPASPWEDINWSASTKDNFGNLIIVGNTLVETGNTDVSITKYDTNGNIIWQNTYDGGINSYDYGIALTTDLSNNVYVAAATSSFSSVSITTLKYSSSGNLLWNQSYQVPNALYQSPSTITLDNTGNVIVVGGAFSTISQTDWIVLKYDNSGSQVWNKTYDYVGLHEIPTNIKILPNDDVIINGFSSPTTDNWDFVSLALEKNNGSTLSESRTALPNLNIDNGFAFDLDINSNFFIAGTTQTNSGSDIKLIKLSESFDIEWDIILDGKGMDDIPISMDSDSDGNAIIIANSNVSYGNTEILTTKIAANTGEEIWRRSYMTRDTDGYAKATKIICTNDDEIFVAGTIKDQNETDYSVFMYDANGNIKLERIYNHGAGSKDVSTDLIVTDNEIIITGTTEDTEINYTTVKYTLKRKFLNPIIVNNKPSHNDNEVIVKFHAELVNDGFVNDKRKRFGSLNEVLPSNVVDQIIDKLGIRNQRDEVCAVKIFHRMTTADTVSITRLGRNINIPKFWCTFLLILPESVDEVSSVSVLNSMPEYVEFTDLNHLRTFDNIPNDTYFLSDQAALFPTSEFPNANINIDPAWDIQQGGNNVKVSINDEVIAWGHEDFGDGTFAGSNIVGGWDFKNDAAITNTTPGNHGTGVAGIIGALRNNGTGIAGIAGGDVDNLGNIGAQLFSLGLDSPDGGFVTTDIIAAAIVEGAVFNPTTGFGYGLNVQNNSYGGPFWNSLERNAVKVCFQNECTFVASRGNDLGFDLNYPACYVDGWELNVGASRTDGEWKEGNEEFEQNPYQSAQGGDIDVIAPGSPELIPTTIIPGTVTSCVMDDNYACFGQTSAAAPHVAGLAALMYAEHQPVNGQWNNLAPDDIEHLIQVNATNIVRMGEDPISGYDEQSGFGRIDAGATMAVIDGPVRRVFHSLAPSNRTLSTAVNQEIIVSTATEGIPAGTYYGDRITIVDSYLDVFPDYNIVDWWDRLSGTTGISAANPSIGNPWGNFVYTINGGVAAVTATTYTYHFTSNSGGQSIDIWYPDHPDNITTAYSLHLRATTTNTTEILKESDILIYPNPSTNKIFIELQDENNLFERIQLFDSSGRLVKDIEDRNLTQIELNISNLSSGSYFCKVITHKGVFHKLIVKQ